MKDFLKRLTSRKFLLAVGGILVSLSHSNVPGAVAVVLGYLGVQGASDFVSTKNSSGQ